jgi:hypothetical protein
MEHLYHKHQAPTQDQLVLLMGRVVISVLVVMTV